MAQGDATERVAGNNAETFTLTCFSACDRQSEISAADTRSVAGLPGFTAGISTGTSVNRLTAKSFFGAMTATLNVLGRAVDVDASLRARSATQGQTGPRAFLTALTNKSRRIQPIMRAASKQEEPYATRERDP
jgi:hypothetical protein